ncbi:MAG TPA: serine/threonine-protein kinase [Vicinamibacterales bacterium]|nr:serine/threonine-protein kinase [Vicinamibacterales bacterium]
MDSRRSAVPQTIGRFRVDAVLGSGGMGAVYKAFDPTLQRMVAIKTVRPDMNRPELLERLVIEAQACARLRHPNVVVVHEAGRIDDTVYVVMELLQGVDLDTTLRRGGLTFEAKLKVLIQILDALEHAHREAVIHRDIKPANVYVLADGSIKLVDFGLARVAESSPLTQTGDVVGTPDYASPEQLRGTRVDHRCDIYSVGALAYEMISGRRPFRTMDSEKDSVGAVILRVMSEPAPPMDVPWTRTHPQIEHIVARAMAKDPADRYQTAEDMRAAVTAFAAAPRDASSARPEATAITVALTEAPTVAVGSPASRSKTAWIVGGLVAAAVTVALGVRWGWAPANAAGPAAPPAAPVEAAKPSSVEAPPPSPTNEKAPIDAQKTGRDSAPRNTAAVPAAGASIASTSTGASARELFTATSESDAHAANTGLRYRLVRLDEGRESDVDPATAVFHSGDRVRFTFDANIDGYLYVVQQGSSGRWTVLFPNADINGGRNAIRRGEEYQIPDGNWFRFDKTPGIEQVFVFLSREPMAQLPGFDRPVTRTETVTASVVEDLQHRIASRDLVLEQAAGASGDSRSHATYVVNRTEVGRAVAASITLTHE